MARKANKDLRFFRPGSTHSFCDIGIVNELGITGRKQSISLQTHATLSKWNISDLKGKERLILSKVISIDEIPIQPNAIPLNKDLSKLSYLNDVTFDTIPGGTVDLLLGEDNPGLFLPSRTCKGPRGLPSATLHLWVGLFWVPFWSLFVTFLNSKLFCKLHSLAWAIWSCAGPANVGNQLSRWDECA